MGIPKHITQTNDEGVEVFAICCTACQYLYDKIPTPSHWEKSVKVFGRQPEWIQDALPRERFRGYGILG